MIGPFLCELHSLSGSDRPWGLPLGWIPLWAYSWTFLSLGSSPFQSLQFCLFVCLFVCLFRQEQLLEFMSYDCGGEPPPSLDVLYSCWWWAL